MRFTLPIVALCVLLGLSATVYARTLKLTSPAFADHTTLPTRFTCNGAGISPPLAWHGAPRTTRGYALILIDPDAPNPQHPPTHTFVHWVVTYLPAGVHALAADQSTSPPVTRRAGINSTGHPGYTPPCPPAGRHRYIFTLYALDTAARLVPAGAHRAEVLAAIAPHVIARAQLIGTYPHHPH